MVNSTASSREDKARASESYGPAPDPQSVVNQLYGDYFAALQLYVSRIISDPYQAEDIVQETMVRAWRHADALSRPELGSAWGWLKKVARNIAIDKIRARRARPDEVEESAGVGVGILGDHSDDVLTSMSVANVLLELIPEHRSVLYEVYFADRTAAGAADVLGIPVGTVKSRLHYALRKLKTSVEPTELVA
ncbi:RNA polymerase sigma-70 factor, ECF subfamily [Saccharopolyspora shandongensis]|uniref:RNA polymerase sigma-70 factor, ECF subfamily n=1 Tax=Saccharopolyspora shandongensis TaxID=418495 RepID=A0A1H3SKB3_9PSEU|nr:sigma-70 family RNA polymerase sigma factor [Saccharopolyspora shandongensis]SDZ38130.1 RNA polymerase sigma-70 factor, ECF subfamily [Saccharopolyspora shandongensis]